MAKSNKNSGFERQNAVLSQFQRDAKSSNCNSAVGQCMKGSDARKAYRDKMAKKNEIRFSSKLLISSSRPAIKVTLPN